MSKYGYRKILERNRISLQECLVPAASFFEPSQAFYILRAVNNGREDLEVWVGVETDTVCETILLMVSCRILVS
jgi:hypothetical protein